MASAATETVHEAMIGPQVTEEDGDGRRATPVLDAVRVQAALSSARLHTPGHEGGVRAPSDLVEVVGEVFLDHDVWLGTGQQAAALRAAEDLAASAWGAERAWLVGNGATAGNLAWMLAMVDESATVLIGRDAHTSILAGLMLSGASPVWVPPRISAEHAMPLGVEAEDVRSALATTGGVRQLLITSPGYASTCADVPAMVEIARHRGIRTYVDQAWGPHLAFHPGLPPDGIAAGASGAVISLHKTGTALSSGAILLAGGGLDREDVHRLDAAVRMTQTTSPSMPLLASVDSARRDLVAGGRQVLAETLDLAADLSARVRSIRGLRVLDARELGLPPHRVDPLKVVIDVTGWGVTGWQVEKELRAMGVAPEGSDDRRVYLVRGAQAVRPRRGRPDRRSANAVVGALSRLSEQLSERLAGTRATGGHDRARPSGTGIWQILREPARQALTPRQAYRAPTTTVPAAAGVGRIAAEAVVPYPPGVPVLLPGEAVSGTVLEFLGDLLAQGGHLRGCADPGLRTLRVIRE